PYIQLLPEVIPHPQVVVAGKHFYGNAHIGQLGQLAQEARISFRYDILIFEPDIKEVTHQEDRMRRLPDLIQPFADKAFSFDTGFVIRQAQVKVGSEIDIFSLGYVHILKRRLANIKSSKWSTL